MEGECPCQGTGYIWVFHDEDTDAERLCPVHKEAEIRAILPAGLSITWAWVKY